MTLNVSNAQIGEATTEKRTFSRTTTVTQQINADPSKVWELLTNASEYPNWNSTIISINGKIAPGEKIELKSTLDSTRTFKLKVKEFEPNQRLVWGDAMGSRIFTLEKNAEGVMFTMSEKIGGPIFPLFANKIPSFDESFTAFASDLKKAAEI